MFIFLLACILPYQVLATINIIDKGLVPLELNSVGIQFFVDIENEDRRNECLVHSWTKRCCLTDSEKEDCNIMHVYSPRLSNLKPRDRETLLHVYPTLIQHDQMGFCEFAISWKCGKNNRNFRDIVGIPFDTRIPNGKFVPILLQNYVVGRRREECSFIDEDTLNDCGPVNCDQKYSEVRPFYDFHLSKCIEAANCPGTIGKDLPDVAYVPNGNICRNLEKTLTMEDVSEISRGLVVTTESEPPMTRKRVKVEIKSNCSTVSQNLFLLKDLMFGKLTPVLNIDTSDYKLCVRMALIKIITCTAVACVILLGILCCFNCICMITKIIKEGSVQQSWQCFKSKFQKKPTCDASVCQYNVSRINEDVKNSLLRQVIVRDIPMELRESVVDICDRMDRDIRWKKRYRQDEVVSLQQGEDQTSETSSMSDEERQRLLN